MSASFRSTEDILTSTSSSDDDVAQWILRLWRDAVRGRAHSAASFPQQVNAPSHHNDSSLLKVAAVRLFGDTSAGGDQLCMMNLASVRRRYRQLALRVHPDKNTSADAAEAFQLVQSCFEFVVAAGDGAAGWTWRPQPAFNAAAPAAKGTFAQSREASVQHRESDDADIYENRMPSVPSSLFSSSDSPRSRSSSAHSSVSSASSSGTDDASPHASQRARPPPPPPPPPPVFPQYTSSQSCSFATRNAEVPLPEPPSVFFTPQQVPPEHGGAKGSGLHGKGRTAHDTASAFSPPPPPPPNVFCEDVHPGSSSSDETSTSPPDLAKHFTVPSKSHNRDGDAKRKGERREKNSKAFPQQRFEKAFFAAGVPPPPSVFEEHFGASVGEENLQHSTHVKGSKSQQRQQQRKHRVRRPELPTLAELLARLDEEDDEADSFRGLPHRSERTPMFDSPSYGSAVYNHSTTASTTTSNPYFYDPSYLSDALQRESEQEATHRRYHHRESTEKYSGARGAGAIDKVSSKRIKKTLLSALESEDDEGDAKHCSAHATPLFPKTSNASARTSVLPTGSKSKSAASEFVVGGFTTTTKHPSLTSPSAVSLETRSRRVGGGAKLSEDSSTMRHVGREQRCACGKARKGQCFLCE